MHALVRHVEGVIIESICEYLFSHENLELKERLAIIFYGDIQTHVLHESDIVQDILKGFKIFSGYGELTIDALIRHIDATEYI